MSEKNVKNQKRKYKICEKAKEKLNFDDDGRRSLKEDEKEYDDDDYDD